MKHVVVGMVGQDVSLVDYPHQVVGVYSQLLGMRGVGLQITMSTFVYFQGASVALPKVVVF